MEETSPGQQLGDAIHQGRRFLEKYLNTLWRFRRWPLPFLKGKDPGLERGGIKANIFFLLNCQILIFLCPAVVWLVCNEVDFGDLQRKFILTRELKEQFGDIIENLIAPKVIVPEILILSLLRLVAAVVTKLISLATGAWHGLVSDYVLYAYGYSFFVGALVFVTYICAYLTPSTTLAFVLIVVCAILAISAVLIPIWPLGMIIEVTPLRGGRAIISLIAVLLALAAFVASVYLGLWLREQLVEPPMLRATALEVRNPLLHVDEQGRRLRLTGILINDSPFFVVGDSENVGFGVQLSKIMPSHFYPNSIVYGRINCTQVFVSHIPCELLQIPPYSSVDFEIDAKLTLDGEKGLVGNPGKAMELLKKSALWSRIAITPKNPSDEDHVFGTRLFSVKQELDPPGSAKDSSVH